MKKKPDKKIVSDTYSARGNQSIGYNQACKEWEEFLPTEEELHNILAKTFVCIDMDYLKVAQVISKRIRGTK